jgi:hypothetical protein
MWWAPTLAELQASGKVGDHGQLRKDAFKRDTTLTKLVLPEGVTSIEHGSSWGEGVFLGCSSLQELVHHRSKMLVGPLLLLEMVWSN